MAIQCVMHAKEKQARAIAMHRFVAVLHTSCAYISFTGDGVVRAVCNAQFVCITGTLTRLKKRISGGKDKTDMATIFSYGCNISNNCALLQMAKAEGQRQALECKEETSLLSSLRELACNDYKHICIGPRVHQTGVHLTWHSIRCTVLPSHARSYGCLHQLQNIATKHTSANVQPYGLMHTAAQPSLRHSMY